MKNIEKPDWQGKTVICIASGPSLTQQDCEIARRSGHMAVVTNTSFRIAPWADVLFAFDHKWWVEYHKEVERDFRGLKISYSRQARHFGVQSLWNAPWFANFGNSGACAIELCIAAGAKKVILIGYDCSTEDGSHWHGDHPKNMSNCKSVKRWPSQFKSVAKDAERLGVLVINASRKTALKCFQRMTLEDAIK